MSEENNKDKDKMSILELEKRKSKSNCPHCGKPISLNARFCSKCGNKIDKHFQNEN